MKEVHPDTNVIGFENGTGHCIRSKFDDSLDELTEHRNKLVEIDKMMDDMLKYQRSSEEKYIESLNGFDKSLEKTNDNVGRTLLMFGRLKNDVDELSFDAHKSNEMTFDVITSLLIGLSKIEKLMFRISCVFVILMIVSVAGIFYNMITNNVIEYGLIGCTVMCAVIAASIIPIDKVLGDVVDICRGRVKRMIKEKSEDERKRGSNKDSR